MCPQGWQDAAGEVLGAPCMWCSGNPGHGRDCRDFCTGRASPALSSAEFLPLGANLLPINATNDHILPEFLFLMVQFLLLIIQFLFLIIQFLFWLYNFYFWLCNFCFWWCDFYFNSIFSIISLMYSENGLCWRSQSPIWWITEWSSQSWGALGTGALWAVFPQIRAGVRTWNDFEDIESCTLEPPVLEVDAAIKKCKAEISVSVG